MLIDLLTSSRGPGVIGTVLALIVLLGFGSLMLMVTVDTEVQGPGAQIKAKQHKITALKGKKERWKDAVVEYKTNRSQVSELEGLNSKIKRRKAAVEQGKSEVDGLHAKTAELVQKFEGYKKKYRISERSNAIGEELGTLTTKSGKVYERVKIKEVSALELRFSHKNGSTGVSFNELPDELQDRFQFSAADAKAMTATIQKNVRKSVAGGERYRVSKDILYLKNKIRQNNEYITRWSAEIRRKEIEITSNEAGEEAANDRASQYRRLPNRGLNWDNAKKQERKADLLRRRSGSAASLIRSNQGKISAAEREVRGWESKMSKLEAEFRKLKK
jgi:hypothetical protein